MDVLSIFMLMGLVGKCKGNSYLIYQEKEEVISLECEEDIWQLDLDEDNMVDCTLNDNKNKCKNTTFELGTKPCKNSTKQCLNIKLEEHVTGFFACSQNVTSNDITLFPFKPSTYQVESFIVSFSDPAMVKLCPGVETKTSVTIQHGEPVYLTCHFTVTQNYSNFPVSVYWIKTISGKSSTCLHSYYYDATDGQLYDHHCLIDEALLNKMSYNSSTPLANTSFHDLKISNATYSDSGQYVCALQVLKGKKGHWKVITNVTVTVNGDINNNTIRNYTSLLYTLYVVGVLFFSCLFVAAIVIAMRKNTEISQESHTLRMKRDQDGEETLYSECSPYAVVRGEEEEHAAVAAEPYFVVMLNTEYEAFDP